MSLDMSVSLQRAVFARLAGDAALGALVGGAIYDGLPAGPVPPLYISLGPEELRDSSGPGWGGARIDFIISIFAAEAGFLTAKELAAAVHQALGNGPLTLEAGRLVGLDFLRASARRNGGGRRIDLRFRARVDYGQPLVG